MLSQGGEQSAIVTYGSFERCGNHVLLVVAPIRIQPTLDRNRLLRKKAAFYRYHALNGRGGMQDCGYRTATCNVAEVNGTLGFQSCYDSIFDLAHSLKFLSFWQAISLSRVGQYGQHQAGKALPFRFSDNGARDDPDPITRISAENIEVPLH